MCHTSRSATSDEERVAVFVAVEPLFGGKRYNMADYLIALGVMAGCTVFAMYGPTTSKKSSKGAKETGMYGVALMLGYLGFDGFTSTFQDKLFKGYQMETYNQMLWVNFCSALISSFWLLSDSSMGQAIAFIQSHPESMYDVLILSAASTCGQLCILYTIREFGALLFATIMTTRQFLSILLSCILFLHPLTWQQWCGTALVFSALYYQAFLKVRGRGSPARHEERMRPFLHFFFFLSSTYDDFQKVPRSDGAVGSGQVLDEACSPYFTRAQAPIGFGVSLVFSPFLFRSR